MLLLSLAAAAIPPDRIQARLDEVAPLRSLRISAHAPDLPEDAWAQVTDGAVVTGVMTIPGHRAKLGWGVAVLEVGIERLWAGLNDEEAHQEILGMGHIERVSGAPCTDRRQVMMLLPLPVVSDRWWVVENRYNAALAAQTGGSVRELAWTGLPDPLSATLSAEARQKVAEAVPVTFNHGAWLLIALDAGHTMVEYFSWSDPGGELPAGPATTFAGAIIERTITTMGRYAATQTPSCL